MIVERRPQAVPGRPLVELRMVSRGFAKKVDRQRSLQEVFIRLFAHQRTKGIQFWPLREVSLSLEAGEAVAIIGPNGSGKSTLLKLITGILIPSSGTLMVNARISSLLELGAGFQPDLTGRENIYLNGSIYGLSRAEMNERLDQIIDYAELGDFIDTPVKHYSSGMFMRLGFAVAIFTDPELLLVDEVLAVGDAAFQQKCLRSIQEFRDRGGALLFVSHDLDAVQRICKRALWLENGAIQAEGHPTDVVMAYTNHVAWKEANKTQADDQVTIPQSGRRWGTGAVRLAKVEIIDAGSRVTTVVHSGDALTIRLHYTVTRPIEDPVFGLAIYHQDGTHITGPNTRFSNLRISHLDTDGFIDYHISALPLLQGRYALSVAIINSSDTETYDYLDRLHHFQVYPGIIREQYGMFTLGGEWQHQLSDSSSKELLGVHEIEK